MNLKNPLFKGLVRPPMFLGVPMTIFVPVALGVIIIFILSGNMFVLFSLVPIWAILRALAMKDDFIFELLLQKIPFVTNRKSDAYHGAKTFSAISYDKSKTYEDLPVFTTLDLSKEKSFESFIPYSSLIDDSVVFTKDYRFLTTYKVHGVSWEVESDSTLKQNQRKIEGVIKALNNKDISFYVQTIRRKTSQKFSYAYKSTYLQMFADAYYKTFSRSSLYENVYYITVIYSPFNNPVDRKAFGQSKSAEKSTLIEKHLKRFKEETALFASLLKVYSLTPLSVYREKDIKYSEQLEFYGFLLSGVQRKVVVAKAPIYKYLTGGLKRIHFGKNTAILDLSDNGHKFIKIIEIKEYDNDTKVGILNTLMGLDVEYTLTQSFSPMNSNNAKVYLKRKRNQLIEAQDDGKTQIEQFEDALDKLVCGDIVLGKYHFVLTLFANSKEEIMENLNTTLGALSESGIEGIPADMALPSSYFSQLPSNFRFRPRVHTITSPNFADLISLHNMPKGRAHNNCWGDCILPLKTPNNQSYFLNLHRARKENDFGEFYLANFLVFGESGGGKTAFLMLLLNMLLKYNNEKTFPKNTPKHSRKATFVFLDKDKGALGNILAIGGKYIEIEKGKRTGFNPFMCDYSEDNISHLHSLMKILVTQQEGQYLNTAENENLNRCIKTILRFDKSDRHYPITLLTQLLSDPIDDNDSLLKRLKLWTTGNTYGWVFDNTSDNFDFSEEYSVFGIDGTEFLDDKDTKDPISYYIFWRVLELVDGRRFGLIGDEAHAWLENETVRTFVYNKEKTIRKENGFLGFATQSIEDIVENKIARTMVEQAASIFFFPNEQGRESDYVHHLSCTQKEFETIKEFRSENFNFLVKRKNEEVVVSADLSQLPSHFLKILSTSKTYVDDVKKIFEQDIPHDKKVENLIKFYKEENEKSK